MSKMPVLYRVGKFLLTPIFKLYFNPQISGIENIPEDGAILIVGNHINFFDQFHAIISTKRFITYMAKDEYFKSKKTKWFFKGTGCIPVNRSIHDDSAKNKAMEVLNNGDALGLFPEGTRNGLKEERILELHTKYYQEITDYDIFKAKLMENKVKTSQINLLEKLFDEKKITLEEIQEYLYNPDEYLHELVKKKIISKCEYENSILLPFKFGAVSMAKKKNAYLVPFGISGEYKFRSKNLRVKFGRPFKVGDMSLEEANDKLFKEVLKLIND